MCRLRIIIIAQIAALAALMVAPAVQAQASRTWVSGVGDDANPCSRTAPCKTFAGAISKTAAGGEISVLDPGGFGAVTITKSITIDGDGTLAGILVSGTNGIVVNATATDKVIIRNVSFNGLNTGLNGIRYLAAGELMVDKVTFYGFQGTTSSQAIDVALAASGKLLVNDTTITNCANGIRLNTAAGTLQATLDNVRIENTSGQALEALAGTIIANVKRSNFSHNSLAGVRAGGASAIANVDDTLLAFNNVGVNAAVPGARIRISNNVIVNNTNGVTFAVGGFVDSAGNNRIDGNGSTQAPNGTFVTQ